MARGSRVEIELGKLGAERPKPPESRPDSQKTSENRQEITTKLQLVCKIR
jgi:hypothetical protein